MDDSAVTVKKSIIDWAAVEEAFQALQPFYESGDDGDSVRLALDAIVSVLADAKNHEFEGDEPLLARLDALKVPSELTDMIENLYEVAEGGSYGEGMSGGAVDTVNKLVEHIEGP